MIDFGVETLTTDPTTGGSKGEKPVRMSLVPGEALAEVAKVYTFGASKYDDHNWRRGYPWRLSYDAATRHMMAFWAGEDMDPESGLPHLGHAVFHMLTLITFMREHPELDDRPHQTVGRAASAGLENVHESTDGGGNAVTRPTVHRPEPRRGDEATRRALHGHLIR